MMPCTMTADAVQLCIHVNGEGVRFVAVAVNVPVERVHEGEERLRLRKIPSCSGGSPTRGAPRSGSWAEYQRARARELPFSVCDYVIVCSTLGKIS